MSGNERIRLWPCAVLVFMSIAVSNQPTACRGDQRESHPLDPALMIAQHSLQESRANIQDYTAILVKRLRVNGELSESQHISLKLRNRKTSDGRVTTPMAVYLKFLRPRSARGREVIWVEGKNRGRLIAHETGFKNLFRVNLEPTGYVAMRGQRYPITDIGMENLVVKMIETAERDRKFGECQVQIYENAKINSVACSMVEVIHPVKRPYFDFHRARIFFDDELNLPIRYASWSWPVEKGDPPVLEEEYTYTNVKVNVALTDRDFDPDNGQYNFP